MAERIVVLDVDLRLVDAHAGRVDLKKLAAVGESHADTHVVPHHVTEYGTQREPVAV